MPGPAISGTGRKGGHYGLKHVSPNDTVRLSAVRYSTDCRKRKPDEAIDMGRDRLPRPLCIASFESLDNLKVLRGVWDQSVLQPFDFEEPCCRSHRAKNASHYFIGAVIDEQAMQIVI